MAIKHVAPCEVTNLFRFRPRGDGSGSNALVKEEAFEAIVMQLDPSKPIPAHSVEGPIMVQCLEGKLDFSVEGESRIMRAGDWMYLPGGTSHALEAHEASRILVTILFAKG